MAHRRAVSLISIAIFLVAVGRARAESDAAVAKPAVSGTYSCGFDSDSGYQAPTTNTSVDVGGVFSITIAKDGSISQGDATFSVDDGGAGPAVCTYASGSGSITIPPFLGSLGSASLNLQGDQANSPLCPPGDGTLAFGPTTDGLKFIYTNAAGFIGRGSCGIQAVPKAATFQCTYKVKDATLGTGSGMGSVTFAPRLNQPPILVNTRAVGVSGRDNYTNRACPYTGIGVSFFIVSGGGWDAKASQAENCPLTPFSNPNFTTTAKTIFVTAPGMSGASCEPAPTLLNPEAKIEVTPTSVVFGSSPQTVTIKNPGTATLNLSVFTATGPFDLDPNNNCFEIPAGSSCPIQVLSTGGAGKGKLTIYSDAKPGQTVVPLKK